MTGYKPGLTTQYLAMLLSIVLIYGVLFAEREMRLVSTEKELSMANSIQSSVMPNMFPAFPERMEFDVYASMDPAKEVGGDFYDFFFVGTDRMTESLNRRRDKSPEQLLRSVKEFVKDAPQLDDLTMLVLTYKGCQAGKDGYNE